MESGIDGREDLKRICGIKVVGIAFKTKKGDKVIYNLQYPISKIKFALSIFILFFPKKMCSSNFL